MEKLKKLSTQEISQILIKVCNDVSNEDSISKDLLERSNLLLRVAKHGIQQIAIMTVVAKMRNLEGEAVKKLPHVEIESI